MNIVLVYPPQGEPTYPALAIPSLVAQLRAAGIGPVSVLDLNIESYDYFLTRERLRESSVREVYISAADHGKYLRYLEGNLGAILADSTVSSTEKAKILYSSASHLVEDIFRIRHGADGRSGRGVRRLDGETCLGGSQQSGQPSQGHVLRLLNLHPLRECVCLRCRAGPAGRAGARGA